MNVKTIKTLILKAFVFALGPLLAAVASLVSLPILTYEFGADGWAAIAIGLSVGTAASVFVELGWGLDGVPRVARAGVRARATIFALSTATKLSVFPPVALLAAIASASIAADFKLEAAITAVYATTLGFSAAWYFVGTGTPATLLVVESLPKVASTLIAAGALSFGAPLLAYPLLLLAGTLVAFLLSLGIVLRSRMTLLFRKFSKRRVLTALRGQATALRGRVSNVLYLALPSAILGIVSPSSVAVYASVERLQNMALTLLQVARNTTLGWAGSAHQMQLRWRRIQIAILANSAVGFSVGVVWVLGVNLVADWVFAGEVVVPAEIVWLSAYLIWAICTSRAVGLVGLVTLNSVKQVSDSAGVGAIVGVLLLVVLGALWGALGAIVALAVTETVVLIWQTVALLYVVRRLS